jgi:hypothetical protein
MDVNALLNTAAAVNREVPLKEKTAESMNQTWRMSNKDDGGTKSSSSIYTSPSDKSQSRKVSESTPPSRSRTPWDANGYVLPLTVDIKSASAPAPVTSVFSSESPLGSVSPHSPRHKCSYSHSSLSSYASSSSSQPHSRISSMSTTGGKSTMANIPGVSSLELGLDCPDSVKEYSQPMKPDGIISSVEITDEVPIHESSRPGSPSDAILISKPPKRIDQYGSYDVMRYVLIHYCSTLNVIGW